MNVGSPFIANPQPSELVQSCQGSLHHPPMDAQATPVLGKAFGQDRLDPQRSQRLPVGFRVISSVSLNLAGLRRGRPTWPRMDGMAFTKGSY
jgi:hypothetical protein